MPKITISAVLFVLHLALKLTDKLIRLIYTIMDLVDDGCLNSSSPRPDWMLMLTAAISTLTSLGSDFTQIESKLSESAN